MDASNRSLQRDHAPVTDRMPAALARASGGRGGERLFDYDRAALDELVDTVLTRARSLGATAAAAEVSESSGLSVTVRKGQVETIEQTRDKGLGITVHRRPSAWSCEHQRLLGRRRCSALSRPPTTSPASPARTRSPACPMRTGWPATRAILGLFDPWHLPVDQAIEARARDRTGQLRRTSAMIRNSDGASVSHRSRPFRARPIRSAFAAAIPTAGTPSAARRSPSAAATCSATTGTRRAASAARSRRSGARSAAMRRERALARLGRAQAQHAQGAGAVSRRRSRSGCSAASCRPPAARRAYRKTTFLVDSLGKPVFAEHIDIHEDPFIPGAMGSGPVRRRRRRHDRAATSSKDGVLQGLLPLHLQRAQARHADHRQCRRLAQPAAVEQPHPHGRRLRRRCCASSAPDCC